MQVFVVFTGSEIYSWLNFQVIPIVSFPNPWGDVWIIEVVWLTNSFPGSLN